jgi:hypothetical protein
MLKQRLLVLVSALFVSGAALAGDAGCGLGSMIITKNTKISQTLALTTNGSFLTQLFGITSGTSGCSASGWVMNNKEAVQYAETNFQNLKVDMARGSGESLAALTQIVGCAATQSESVGQVTRDSFSKIVTSEDITAVDMLQNWGRVLRESPQTARTCGLSV